MYCCLFKIMKTARLVEDKTKLKISVSEDSDSLYWIYYNPDASSGGQFVYGSLSFKDFEEQWKQYDILSHPENAERLGASLEEISYQILVDIDTSYFKAAVQDYEEDCDYIEFTAENLLKIHELIEDFRKTEFATPPEAVIPMDDIDWDEERIADWLSDTYGYCVIGYSCKADKDAGVYIVTHIVWDTTV